MPPRRYIPEPKSCCSCNCGGSNSAINGTIAMGISLGISFLLIVVAGAVYRDFLPFVNLAFVVLLPIAVLIGDLQKPTKYLESTRDVKSANCANFGACILGVILISMIALPLVLLHINALTIQGFALWIASTIITGTSAIAYWFTRGSLINREQDF